MRMKRVSFAHTYDKYVRGGLFMRTVLFFIFLSLFFQYDQMTQPSFTNELTEMAQAVQKQNLNIYEWDITYRDKVNKSLVYKITETLKTKEKDIQKYKDYVKYIFTEKDNQKEVTTVYNIVVPHKTEQADVTITVSGENLDGYNQINFIQEKIETVNKFLTNSPSIFTCLSAKDSGIIESGISTKNIMDELNVLHRLTQFDKHVESKYKKEIYGYQSNWNEQIIIDHSPINVQIVLERDKNKRNLITIGTPIILNEY